MPARIDLSGQVFGRWTVLRYAHRGNGKNANWLCKCDCGAEKTVCGTKLRRGLSLSCGCLRRERLIATNTAKNPLAGQFPATYETWIGMKRRCNNANHAKFKNYGLRGICVCARWKESFSAFLDDMGPKPDGKSIDRIDNNGGYCKENCRWATAKEQNNNKRNNRLLTYNGTTMTLTQWGDLPWTPGTETIAKRLYRGSSVANALTRPVQRRLSKQ